MTKKTTPTATAPKNKTATAPKKKGRSVYAGDRDGSKQLTAVPTDFDSKAHKPLIKKDFSTVDLFIDFRATLADAAATMFAGKAASATKNAADLREKAGRLRLFGDEKSRRSVGKLERLRSTAADIVAELQGAEGVDQAALAALVAGFASVGTPAAEAETPADPA